MNNSTLNVAIELIRSTEGQGNKKGYHMTATTLISLVGEINEQ